MRGFRTVRLNLEQFEDRTVPTNVANVLVNNPAADPANGNFTQSETSTIVVPGANPIVLVSYNDSGSFVGGANRFTGYARSTDGGATFTDMGALTSANNDAGDPVFARNSTTGRIYLATLAFTGSGIQVFRSDNNGASFLAPVNAAPGTTGFQDKESIAVDNFPGAGNGNVYMATRDFGADNGIFFYRSTDHGATWGPSNGTRISNGGQGAYVVVGTDHSVYVFHHAGSEMRVRRSTDFGVTFSPAVTVTNYVSSGINGDLGLSFRTSTFPVAAVNPVNGNLYVVYPDLASSGSPDIFFVQSNDQGATWSAPRRVNNDATTRDQWQPSLAVSPDGQRLFMGWYDRRLDVFNSMIDNFGMVADINTTTGAVTFNPNFRITDTAYPENFGNDGVVNSTYMGDYDYMDADANFFYYVWADNRLGTPDVRLARIPTTGPRGPTVFTTSPTGTVTTAQSSVTVTFSEAMNPTSFSLSDIISFTGPLGAPFDDVKPYVTGFTWTSTTTLRIDFITQVSRGLYTMVLSPDIRSQATGLQLDENLNGTPGETPADNVTIRFTYNPGKGYTTPPTPNAGGPYTVNEGSNVTLAGNATDAKDAVGVLIFQWDLDGDGIFGESGANATRGNENVRNPTFQSSTLDGPSSVTVRLRVTNTDGLTSSPVNATINVVNVPPTPSISGPSSVGENTAVTFTASATDPSAADTTAGFTFNWSITENGNPFTNFSGQGTNSITFTDTDAPAIPDNFVIMVTATDKDSGSASTTKNLTVNNLKPTATFTNDSPPASPKKNPASVLFTFASQTDPSPDDVLAGFLYSYDFNNDGDFTDPGDIADSISPTTTFFYPNFGTFIVRGQIKDKDGAVNDYLTTVQVDKVGNGGIIDTVLYATAADAGGGPHVRVFNRDGSERFSFFAYDETFSGGVRVATGDVTGDGTEDLITAAGPTGGPHVRIFNGVTGALDREFFALPPSFTGGLYVASADVNNDNWDDILVSAGPGGGTSVIVYSGRDLSILNAFSAYGPGFGGAVNIATGDVNGDGFADIITGAGASGGPHVRVIDGQFGVELYSFFAFEPSYSGGVTVAAGDVNGDGLADLITGRGPEPGTDSVVRVFSGSNLAVLWDFVAYPAYRGGLRLGSEDVNGDGADDIIIAPGRGTQSNVLVLNGRNLVQLRNFFAYDPGFLGGVNVG